MELPWLVYLSGLGVGWEPKGCQFNSQSGHMPGFAGQVPSRGVRKRQPHTDVSLPLLSFPSPL